MTFEKTLKETTTARGYIITAVCKQEKPFFYKQYEVLVSRPNWGYISNADIHQCTVNTWRRKFNSLVKEFE